jgi:hypothetical protein
VSLFCRHEWMKIHSKEIRKYLYEDSEMPIGRKYITVYECSKCKKLKKQKVDY